MADEPGETAGAGDVLVRALALGGRARVAAALASDTVEELRRIHDPSPTTAAALGRLAVGTLLLAASLEKVTGREPMLTVEIDGGGPAAPLLATASPSGWVRAMARNPLAASALADDGSVDVGAVVGDEGHLVVTRDPGVGEPYRGVTQLETGEIAHELARYLVVSEQSSAAVVLGEVLLAEGRVDRAGGLLVELLPGVSDEEARALASRIEAIGPLSALLSAGETPRRWLTRLFGDEVELLAEDPVRFLCGCSLERVEGGLKLLGVAEIRDLIRGAAGGREVELVCGLCRRAYVVPRDDLARLLFEVEAELGGDAERPADA